MPWGEVMEERMGQARVSVEAPPSCLWPLLPKRVPPLVHTAKRSGGHDGDPGLRLGSFPGGMLVQLALWLGNLYPGEPGLCLGALVTRIPQRGQICGKTPTWSVSGTQEVFRKALYNE